jgi:hypothetical protein
MSNISGKINLLMLKGAVKKMKAQSGEIECLVIPIVQNNLFKGEKGIYLDLIAFEIKREKGDSKDTHLIKQSLPKDIREKMTQEELNAMPILGNIMVWGEHQEQEPVSSLKAIEEVDDLPF